MAIVKRLSTSRAPALRLAEIDLAPAILPVEYARVEHAIARLIGEHRPDAVLHLGLAGRRRKMSIEIRALNRLNHIHPDAAGRFAGRMTCSRDATFIRHSQFAVAQILAAIKTPSSLAARSIDAGDYLCNQALFATLGQFRGPAGFIHILRPERLTRPRRNHGKQRPTLNAMIGAVETALRIMARQCRLQRRLTTG